jgi:hypothetical protein
MTTEIDFDAASAAWMANKIRRGPALLYKCTAVQKNGSVCPRASRSECVPYAKPHLCTQHSKAWDLVPLTLPLPLVAELTDMAESKTSEGKEENQGNQGNQRNQGNQVKVTAPFLKRNLRTNKTNETNETNQTRSAIA